MHVRFRRRFRANSQHGVHAKREKQTRCARAFSFTRTGEEKTGVVTGGRRGWTGKVAETEKERATGGEERAFQISKGVPMIFPKRRNEGGELRMAAMKSDLAAGWMVNRVAPSWEMCLCAAASHFLPDPPAFLPLSRSLSLCTCIVCIYARAADRSRAPLSTPALSPAGICSPVYMYIRLYACVYISVYIWACVCVCAFVQPCVRAPAGDDCHQERNCIFARVTGKTEIPRLTGRRDSGIRTDLHSQRSFHRHLTHESNGCNGMVVDTERQDLCPCIRRMNLSPPNPPGLSFFWSPRAVTR